MKRRKHIVEESVDNIIVSQEITYPPAALLFMHYSTIHTTYSFLGRRQKGRVRPTAYVSPNMLALLSEQSD